MLKEIETEETSLFCDIFIIGGISIGGGGGPPARAYATDLMKSKPTNNATRSLCLGERELLGVQQLNASYYR